jgi:hypothetical protein
MATGPIDPSAASSPVVSSAAAVQVDVADGGASDGEAGAQCGSAGSLPEASPPVSPPEAAQPAADASPTPAPEPAPQPVPTPSIPAPVPAVPAPVPPVVVTVASAGTLVPLYSYPTDSSWRVVADAKRTHPSVPVIAVINPASGPGFGLSIDYVNGIAALKAAGVSVLGYVSTSYTRRSETAVQADIDSYRQWYPDTTGIFFDEQTNSPGGEDYYRRVAAYAQSRSFTFTVGNPGSDSAPSYVGTVDLILVYENSGLPSAAAMGGWHASYDRHNFGVIPYGVTALDPAFVVEAKAKVGYIYVTGDTLPNPWDTVPPYFNDLVAQLAAP